MTILVVFDATVSPEKLRLPPTAVAGKAFLFPLTSRKTVVERVQAVIGSFGWETEILNTAVSINRSAEKVRDEYLRFIGELSEKIHFSGKNLREYFAVDGVASLWWYSLIAEKNTFKTDSFNRLAQLDAIVAEMRDRKVDAVLFGSRSGRLRESVREYAARSGKGFIGIPVCGAAGLARRLNEMQRLSFIKHAALMFRHALALMFQAREIRRRVGRLRKAEIPGDCMTFVTYYPNYDTEAASKAVFRNNYYAYLQESLEEKGGKIAWVAMHVPNNSIPFEKAVGDAERFIGNGCRMFFLDEFVTLAARAEALVRMLSSGLKLMMLEGRIRKAHRFRDYDIFPLLKDDWYSSFAGATGYDGLLHYHGFMSLLRKNMPPKILYQFEMHAWENALQNANEAAGNVTRLLAYQSGTISRMLLNYWHHPAEIALRGAYPLPSPDKFICNGQIPLDSMRESGWPPEKLALAEAIRYTHLRKYLDRKTARKRNIVFVALSIGIEESCGILGMVHESLRDAKETEVWVKAHPFLDIGEVIAMAGLSAETFPFRIRTEPLRELLPEVKTVIVGESGVAVKALAFGCRIVILDIPEFINMSPLRGADSWLIRTAGSPGELSGIVREINGMDETPDADRDEAKRIFGKYFHMHESSDVPSDFIRILEGERPAAGNA